MEILLTNLFCAAVLYSLNWSLAARALLLVNGVYSILTALDTSQGIPDIWHIAFFGLVGIACVIGAIWHQVISEIKTMNGWD